ncbi:MAG TPA: Ig-like domain-containing protein, partial [Luteolibacter sp.]
TITPGLAADKYNSPKGVFITADDSLWVTDTSNNRLLRFSEAATKGSGSAADGVIGQPDFVSNAAGTTARSLTLPQFHPFADATGSLWVADRNNNRVLRFPPDITKPILVVTTNVPKTVTKKKLTVKGTASDAFGVSKVEYRIGTGPLQTATGTTNWQFTAKLKLGKNKITIIATDAVGNQSLPKVIKVKRVAP